MSIRDWFKERFRRNNPPVLERCCTHVCKSRIFDPHASFGDLRKVPFETAICRIDQIIDDVGVCSNEITKDREAWVIVSSMATLGNKINKLRDEGGKVALHAYIDSLPEQGDSQ